MEYRELGRTGLKVSAVGYGTGPLGDLFGVTDEEVALQSVRAALDSGINLFDTSPYYGSAEERLGKALKGIRDDVHVVTKAGRYGFDDFDFSPARIRTSIDRSLALLGTDHVDVLLLHDIEFVPLGPVLTDSIAELARVREQGKCRFIGISGYPIAMQRRVVEETDVDVVLSYAHGTLLDGCLENDLLPVARDRGVGVVNAAAVALGLLTRGGSRIGIDHPATPEIQAAAGAARTVAERHGADISMLANQYAIQRSGCATTLVGTAKASHLDQAVRAVTEPIDEDLLSEVLDAVRAVRGSCWTSGLPENN